jgi:hypothetical protein
MLAKYIAGAGVGFGVVTNPDTKKEEPSISLVIPKENPVDDDPENPENYDDLFMSVAAAKALQIDLREILEDFDSGKLSS